MVGTSLVCLIRFPDVHRAYAVEDPSQQRPHGALSQREVKETPNLEEPWRSMREVVDAGQEQGREDGSTNGERESLEAGLVHLGSRLVCIVSNIGVVSRDDRGFCQRD